MAYDLGLAVCGVVPDLGNCLDRPGVTQRCMFILAVAVPMATGTGAFVGLIAGMVSVAYVASFTSVAFLWHNVVGAVVVVAVGIVVSAIERSVSRSTAA